LESDLALGMARLLQQTVRPDLKLVVMSATLAGEALSAYLGDCPVVVSEGRLFPVEVTYQPRPQPTPWPEAAADAVAELLPRTAGGVLVFLPGLQEIRRTTHLLEPLARAHDLDVLPLHGDLPPEQQDLALARGGRRKVVLATNVAETSVTVEDVTGVVDTGVARQMVFDPSVGLDRLELGPISRASADQRSGRAGRTAPGVCVRLWSEASHRARPEHTDPEIRRIDLAGAVLQLLALGEADVSRFPWFSPPPEATVTQALVLLQRLGAVADGGVTDLGRLLARLPVHPRLGRMLVDGNQRGHAESVALAAALLSERDPFDRTAGPAPGTAPRRTTTSSDVLERVEAVEAFERGGRTGFPLGVLHPAGSRFVLRARDQLLRLLRENTPLPPAPSTNRGGGENGSGFPIRSGEKSGEVSSVDAEEAVLRSLLAAFPDRVARRREPGGRRGLLVGGRGVRLAPSSGVTESELFVCVDIDGGQGGEALVRQASAVRRDWLPTGAVRAAIEVGFDAEAERVVARRRVRYGDLILEENTAALPDGDQTARALIEAAAARLDRVLPASDSPGGHYLTRLRCLSAWMPELALPGTDEADLRELLPQVCASRKSFAEARSGPWLEVLQGRLTHQQRQAVDRHAPERWTAPTGSQIALTYEEGRPPVLAVRIQEMFGLTETPRVAGGRVSVLLHLLAPNYRPQQVTDDLASFWANTYPQVRKDLRARYPKHAWPEDPLTATPERRPGGGRPAR
jgi:ATP-dependent helicase HrpB